MKNNKEVAVDILFIIGSLLVVFMVVYFEVTNEVNPCENKPTGPTQYLNEDYFCFPGGAFILERFEGSKGIYKRVEFKK